MPKKSVNSVWTDIDTGSNTTQIQELEDWFGAGIIENYIYFLPVSIRIFNVYSLITSFKTNPCIVTIILLHV
jgi:hypothetical protein